MMVQDVVLSENSLSDQLAVLESEDVAHKCWERDRTSLGSQDLDQKLTDNRGPGRRDMVDCGLSRHHVHMGRMRI